jgi:cell wall-associated NlpC family hydrolase
VGSYFLLFLALAAAAPPNAVVILPVANMYSKPSADSDVVSQAICGTNVGIVEEQGDWVKVQTPDNYPGWMPLASLRRWEAGAQPYASSGAIAQVENLFANLYREPDVTKHAPLITLPFEARLELTGNPPAGGEGREGRWLEVRLPDGRQAWVQRGDVTFDPKPLTIKETIELAKRFLGDTYLWGGRSSFGFDCSGFTQMLVRLRGVNMPRDADQQAAWEGVTPVKRNKLKPGDLLFFGGSPDKITHTGMYIGHGKFIHDTTHSHPGVQIGRLKDEPWTKLLVACRRVK